MAYGTVAAIASRLRSPKTGRDAPAREISSAQQRPPAAQVESPGRLSLDVLIGRAGPERFTTAHLVRADERDFPEPWEPTRSGVHALLYRLCWHAYLDVEVVVEDHRPRAAPTHNMLETSVIGLVDAADGRATFQIEAIGNDDVAGLLVHEVGEAFLALLPPDPFREARHGWSPTQASAAAVYLGLGVLVANSSMYPRIASRLEGQYVRSEQQVATAGGLSIEQATLLLAVQDLVRDEVSGALDTLHPPQAEWFGRWRDVLEEHEDELRGLLRLDESAPGRAPLVRAPAPRVPPRAAEPDLRRFNEGRTTFRVPHGSGWLPGLIIFAGAMIGLLSGVLIGALVDTLSGALRDLIGSALPFPVTRIFGIVLMLVGAWIGWRSSRSSRYDFRCADPECGAFMAGELPTCPGCGGTIAETIAHADLRLERLEALAAANDDDRPSTHKP